MKKVAVAVIVLLVIALACFLLISESDSIEEREQARLAEPATTTEIPVAESQPAAVEIVPSSAPVVASTVDAATQPAQPAEEATIEPAIADTPSDAGESRRLKGTIVVTGFDGTRHDEETGTMTLRCWTGDTGEHHRVEVIQGRFEIEISAQCRIDFDDVWLGGRRAVVSGYEEPRYVLGPELSLEAKWPPTTLLHVWDDATRQELQVVLTVWECRDWKTASQAHPGKVEDSDKIRRYDGSPVEIAFSGRRSKATYFVCADGYAWQRIEIDPKSGGHRDVYLKPAGRLTVQPTGHPVPKGSRLRLRLASEKPKEGSSSSGGTPLIDVPLTDAGVELDHIVPGEYWLSAELGAWYDDPLRFGSAIGLVTAGASTSVDLAIDELQEATRVDVGGEVFVPKEWELPTFRMTMELLDTPQPGSKKRISVTVSGWDEVAGGKLYHWQVKGVQAGRYEFEVSETRYLISHEFSAEDNYLEMAVPPPATIVVRAVFAGSGEPAPLASLHWHPVWPKGVTGGSLDRVTRDRETGLFEFRAPVGKIDVSPAGREFGFTHLIVDVKDGVNEVTLEVRYSYGVRIELRSGEARIPWDHKWKARVEPVGGSGKRAGSSWGQYVTLFVTEPGSYRLTLTGLDEFAPIPEEIVEIPADELLEHVVELEPK